MQSVLGRARKIDIVDDPYPHLVIENALEPEYYEKLASEWPATEIILKGRVPKSNRNFRYQANDTLDDERISPRWREFVGYHVSQAFFNEVCALMGSHIRRLNPGLESLVSKPLADWKSGILYREARRDIALECQFTYTAPVEQRSRSIGPHVDRELALYAGLLYMRDDEDDSAGGDLELYRFTKGRPEFDKGSRRVPDERVTRFRTIRYAKNTFVFMLHSPVSLHGVSPRSVTRFPRLNVNFVGEFTTNIFDLTPFTVEAKGSVL